MSDRDEIFRWKAIGPHDIEPEDVTDKYVPIAEVERLRGAPVSALSTPNPVETLERLIRHGIEALRDGDGDTFTAEATLANLARLAAIARGALDEEGRT